MAAQRPKFRLVRAEMGGRPVPIGAITMTDSITMTDIIPEFSMEMILDDARKIEQSYYEEQVYYYKSQHSYPPHPPYNYRSPAPEAPEMPADE
jgi:hypothetical protein